jgi:hypothetical protein
VMSQIDDFLSKLEDPEDKKAIAQTAPTGQTIVAFRRNDSVQYSSFSTLRGNTKVNDEVINFYLYHVLWERSLVDLCHESSNTTFFLSFNSFFVQTLLGEKDEDPNTRGKYNFDAVKKWHKKIKLFQYKHVCIPINDDNFHWTLAWIDVEGKKVTHLDSCCAENDNPPCKKLHHLLHYLQDRANVEGYDDFISDSWKIIDDGKGIPQQTDSTSCGVFVCMFATLIKMGLPLKFSNDHAISFRSRIARELLKIGVGTPQRIDAASEVGILCPSFQGIMNLKNTCYIAASLQLLFCLPQFIVNLNKRYEEVYAAHVETKNSKLPLTRAVLELAVSVGTLSKDEAKCICSKASGVDASSSSPANPSALKERIDALMENFHG